MRETSSMNIIIIITDSLRFDSVYPLKKDSLPYIKNNATQFLKVWSNASWTLPSTASIFTGLLPHQHGATTRSRKLNSNVNTLAEKLQYLGYETIQVTANPATTQIFGLNRGFNKILKTWEHISPEYNKFLHLILLTGKPRMRKILYAGDELMKKFSEEYRAGRVWFQSMVKDSFNLARKQLQDNKSIKPKFIFINLMETHFPYHTSATFKLSDRNWVKRIKELRSMFRFVNQSFLLKNKKYFDQGDLKNFKQRQGASWDLIQHEIDSFVEEFHQGKNNLIILASDHGDAFGEQDWYYHFSNVTDGSTRVPLFWLDPKKGIVAQDATPITLKMLHNKIIGCVSDEKLSVAKDVADHIPIIQSYWYDKKGKTLSKYKKDQFCFIFENVKYLFKDDKWYSGAPTDYFSSSEEDLFRPLDHNINPLEELTLGTVDKRSMRNLLSEFKQFSVKTKI